MSEPPPRRTREAARRASFMKRSKGVLKKARELSVLCDVPLGLMLFGPDDTQPRTWPEDPSAARRVFARYRFLAGAKKKDETTKFKDAGQEAKEPSPPRDDEVEALRGLEVILDGKLEEVSARIALLKSGAVGEMMIPWLYDDGAPSSSAAAHACDGPAGSGDPLALSLACPAAPACEQEPFA